MGEEVLTAEKMDRSEGEYMCVGKSARVRAHTCMWACVQVHVGALSFEDGTPGSQSITLHSKHSVMATRSF